MKDKKVLVSGCFDLFHSGHVSFLKQASTYGNLYVSIGSDVNIEKLKGKRCIFNQNERLYIVRSIKYVKDAFIATGEGFLDFKDDLSYIDPDILIVNEDGDRVEKRELCKSLGIQYVVLERYPECGLGPRSSTEIKSKMNHPYRLSLAGGWIDQPWISCVCSGSMVVVSLQPGDYMTRGGLAHKYTKYHDGIVATRLTDWRSRKNC